MGQDLIGLGLFLRHHEDRLGVALRRRHLLLRLDLALGQDLLLGLDLLLGHLFFFDSTFIGIRKIKIHNREIINTNVTGG